MKVKCDGCGSFHSVSPTAMAVIIYAFQDGDLQKVTAKGVESVCLGAVFTPDTLARWRRKIDAKTVIAFDQGRWSAAETKAA